MNSRASIVIVWYCSACKHRNSMIYDQNICDNILKKVIDEQCLFSGRIICQECGVIFATYIVARKWSVQYLNVGSNTPISIMYKRLYERSLNKCITWEAI